MKSILMTGVFLCLFAMIDDWYKAQAAGYRINQPEKKPDFSDSEVMTVKIAMDYKLFPSER